MLDLHPLIFLVHWPAIHYHPTHEHAAPPYTRRENITTLNAHNTASTRQMGEKNARENVKRSSQKQTKSMKHETQTKTSLAGRLTKGTWIDSTGRVL